MSQAKLNRIQQFIVTQLTRTQHLPQQADARAGAAAALTGNDRLSPVEQLEIYRVQFWLRHTNSLLDDYPGVSGILGQAAWERLVESYLTTFSPTSWTLRDLGDRFAAHIATQPETPHQALCEDMAKLEWMYTELFDAADAPRLDASKIASMSEDAWHTARMIFAPAFRLLQVRYPVADLRRQLREAKADAAPIAIPSAESQNLVLYRNHERRLYHRQVSAAAFRMLTHLNAGVALVPAAERTVEEMPQCEEEVQSQVGAWFQDWGARGFIIDVVG